MGGRYEGEEGGEEGEEGEEGDNGAEKTGEGGGAAHEVVNILAMSGFSIK